jgi:hypothetical protein
MEQEGSLSHFNSIRSWARWIQTTSSHPISPRFTVILNFQLLTSLQISQRNYFKRFLYACFVLCQTYAQFNLLTARLGDYSQIFPLKFFLKPTKGWCTVPFYPHFSSSIWQTKTIMINSWSITLNHTDDPHQFRLNVELTSIE